MNVQYMWQPYLFCTLHKEVTLKVQGSVTTQFYVATVMVLLMLEN